jgi:glycerol-3-phosphate dehydrogenase
MNFSNKNRKHFVQKLTDETFDLLVIGGGITGCGIALDAALRGLKVALVEKNDFASGTSSRSTKLIHGGLRYLKQLEFKLVRDVGSERAVVFRNARHLVIPEKMLLPIVEGGSLGELSTSAGLLVYDLLAGVKRSEHRKMLTQRETSEAEPLLGKNKLLGGGMYFEYRTDDARLVIELAKSAFSNRALLLNYAEVVGFETNTSKTISGAIVKDRLTGKEFTIKAKTVVNAAGPWVDLLRKQDNSLKGKRLQLTKGVHLVFSHSKFPVKQAAYFDVPDGRMIFAIPRNGITYVGTSDTVFNQNIDSPKCSKEDAEYVLKAINNMFPDVNLKISDIESSWAGLRPLIHEDGKSPSELSRKDEIIVSESGLISIAGGKLTGYRLMAKKIVDMAEKKTRNSTTSCKTAQYRLSGGEFQNETDFENEKKEIIALGNEIHLPASLAMEWFYRYGKNTRALYRLYQNQREKYHDTLSAITAVELEYCIENEMVTHPNDYLIRRSGKMFFDINSVRNTYLQVAEMLSNYFGADDKTREENIRETEAEIDAATKFN